MMTLKEKTKLDLEINELLDEIDKGVIKYQDKEEFCDRIREYISRLKKLNETLRTLE